jgi:hypothetical protein
VPLKINGGFDDQSQVITTYVRANEPVEADISAVVPVMVFGSTALLDSDCRIAGTMLSVTGGVRSVVFDRYGPASTCGPSRPRRGRAGEPSGCA